MADGKLKDQTPKTTVVGSDEIYANDVAGGDLDVKLGLDDIKTFMSDSPTLVTPALGTPASGVMTNVSGTAASLTAGNVTTNANSTGDVTSVGNATTIAAKAVEISMLDDGTDGELITWDSSGVAATVAVGTSGQILTSNGAGAAPTFQAGGGGLSNIVEDTTPQLGGDLDGNGFDINLDAGFLITFDTGTQAQKIVGDAGGLTHTVPTSDTHDFIVNATTTLALSETAAAVTGNITVTGTVDGRDVATDGTKLDGIETSADVTDLTNVNAAAAATVGTIGTGTWQGTAVASAFLDADTMHLGVAQAITTDKTFNDNINATFGTGGDADIDYDGTDLKINPQVVGSGNCDIVAGDLDVLAGSILDSGINISPIGAQQQWISAGAWGTVTTNGAEFAELELATNDIMLQTFNFDTTTSEKIQFWWHPPSAWDAGTVTFQPYWTAASGSGTVIFTLAGRSLTDSDAIDAAIGGTSATSTDTLITANDMHISPISGNVTINGATKNEPVLLQISRDISDTLGVDAKFIGVKIIYTTDTAVTT